MNTNIGKIVKISALLGLFAVLMILLPKSAKALENLPITQAADKVATSKTLSAGFYQFNNLEIFKGPVVDEPPATIEVIQKNEKSCVVNENDSKNAQSIPCAFDGNKDNNFTVQIDERTTIIGVNQEPALLSDFQAGEKVNVLGWLSADGTTIRAAVLRSLSQKNFHQSVSGTVKSVSADGFVLVLSNGDEITVKTPVTEGAQITVKGVFDKVNKIISNVLSFSVRPVIGEESAPVEKPATTPAPQKPSTLFKNFLRVFGL
jgi:hypothetical protein